MEDNIWDIDVEKIEPQELTEEEKKIAVECSEMEMEFKKILSEINLNSGEK